MSESAPVPKDHPLMAAWTAYRDTEDYANIRRWAEHDAHVDGSLWAAFEQGWLAAGGRKPFEAPPAPPAEAVRVLEARAETLRRVRDAYQDSYGEDFGDWLSGELQNAVDVAALRAEGEGGTTDGN